LELYPITAPCCQIGFSSFSIPFLFAIYINTYRKCYVGMRKEKKRKENKTVNCRIETGRRVFISTPLYQVGAGTFVT
jgi:hypothetical protein